ncbi:MAG: hypothetical protein OEX12_01100 [Gammaproteobacteria bacterium]|nr:hypothetical protein [Gammaproteobacteria bacterium]
MTLNIGDSRNEYTATSAQTIFNYTFKIYDAGDLDVYVTPAGQECSAGDLTTAYSVSGVGNTGGGTITLVTPTSVNDLVTIVSAIPGNRTTDYQNNGDFRPDTVDDDFDRVVSLVKQVDERAKRSLSFPPCQQGVSQLSMPAPVTQTFLRWKSDLSGLENVTLSASGVAAEVSVNTYAALRSLASTGYSDGQVIFVTGDTIHGWGVVKTGTVVDDGANNIVFNDDANRYWDRLPDCTKISVTHFGAIANNSTDNSTAIKNAIIAARKIRAASSELTNITVWFPDGEDSYNHSEGIPVVSGVYLACQSRNSVTLKCTGTQASFYTATESGGVFTDNLDQPINVNTSENNGIINIRWTHTGTVSANAPDSGVAFAGVGHIHNAPRIELDNLRISSQTNWKHGLYIKNSYGSNIRRFYSSRGASYHGGVGLYIDSFNNSTLVDQPFVFGEWAKGIRSTNPDTVTILEPNVEQAWVNISINGDNPKLFGGYVEGGKISEIDIGWDSATTCQDFEISSIWLNGGAAFALSLVDSSRFRWVLSASGTSEYYLQRDTGALDPQVPKPYTLNENGTPMTGGSIGSLSAAEWGWGDNDSLGYSTIYARLVDSTDPDTKATGWLKPGVHGIRLGRCQGGDVRVRHFEGSYTTEFACETAANGNVGNKILFPRGDASNPALSSFGLNAGRNVVEVVGLDNSDYRQYKLWSTDNGREIQTELNQRGAKFQNFVIEIRNNAATLEARIVSGAGTATAYDTCFETFSATYTALGADVSSGSDFSGSGIGRLSGSINTIVLDNYAQAASSEQGVIVGSIFNSSGTIVCAEALLVNRDINGVTRTRVEIQFTDASTGANFDITTANIAAGKIIKIPVLGFLWDV